MQQIWIVIEDASEPHEPYHWPVAAFTTEEAAQAYVKVREQQEELDFVEAVEKYKLMEQDIERIAGHLTHEEAWEQELAIYDRYPGAHPEYETKHTFYVDKPLPLNPEA